jgi:predicted O-methyltransferase YrrM
VEPGETEARADPLGASMANLSDLLVACLDAAGARTVIEVGAFEGELTDRLLGWAADTDARITAIDPDPTPELQGLAGREARLELIAETSLSTLPKAPAADAVVIDGDHNHYTVLGELNAIAERVGEGPLPLIALHDVCWPHARRDTYYAPDRIPADHRQPVARDVLLAPGVEGTAPAGIRFPFAAEREGGPRNGVLTAVEDFLADRDGLRFALVPAFFGMGVIWPEGAHWGSAVGDVLEPWDRNEMIERLEEIRIAYIVDRYRLEHQEALLRSLLDSRAFALAERLSEMRRRGDPAISRDEIRRVLGA